MSSTGTLCNATGAPVTIGGVTLAPLAPLYVDGGGRVRGPLAAYQECDVLVTPAVAERLLALRAAPELATVHVYTAVDGHAVRQL